MKRAILLQALATKSKKEVLSDFSSKATSEFNRLWDERDFCPKFMDFHHKVYSTAKTNTSFNVQIICDIERSVWRSKNKTIGYTVKFNNPRNCKTFETKSMFFVELGIYPRKRIAVPIKRNRNFERYADLLKNGWVCKTYGLTSGQSVVAYLSKEDAELPQKKNIIGIDFNAKRIAVSVLSDKGKVLHQDYFGMNIWIKRKRIMERRAKMQSSNNVAALKRLRTRERNFVDTNLGQIVKGITDMALRFDADIAIENLKRFASKGKRFNKTVMRMPFGKFREILASRCFDKGITLNIMDSWHTSKFCNHCGAVGKGHESGNYALFGCKECGVEMNSDRNASKNIALKCLLERKDFTNHKPFQISNGRVPVNGLLRQDEVGLPNVAVQHAYQPMKASDFTR